MLRAGQTFTSRVIEHGELIDLAGALGITPAIGMGFDMDQRQRTVFLRMGLHAEALERRVADHRRR